MFWKTSNDDIKSMLEHLAIRVEMKQDKVCKKIDRQSEIMDAWMNLISKTYADLNEKLDKMSELINGENSNHTLQIQMLDTLIEELKAFISESNIKKPNPPLNAVPRPRNRKIKLD